MPGGGNSAAACGDDLSDQSVPYIIPWLPSAVYYCRGGEMIISYIICKCVHR